MSYNWPLINDNITRTDREVLSNFILSNERLTNGLKVKEFESVWSKWLGVKHSKMLNSGSSGNFISISIVKELKGIGEVIVPPLGWVSDIAPIIQLGMTPVFVDVSLDNFSITSENIKNAITKNTKAIVLVHCLGFNGINDEIIKIAKDNDILLIEDCCEAHGAMYGDKKVGSFGDMSVFSFYFGHHITTIEGGMISTDNPEIDDLVKLYRSHGMTREGSVDLQKKYQEDYPNLNPLFTFAVPGFNMRSTELNAVLGIEQMKRIDYNIERRKHNLNVWLENLDSEIFYKDFLLNGNSNFALPLIVHSKYKNKFISVCELLDIEKVEYRLGTAGGGNQIRQPYLKSSNYKTFGDFKIVDHIHDYGLYVGNHTELTNEQIIDLCKKLNNV